MAFHRDRDQGEAGRGRAVREAATTDRRHHGAIGPSGGPGWGGSCASAGLALQRRWPSTGPRAQAPSPEGDTRERQTPAVLQRGACAATVRALEPKLQAQRETRGSEKDKTPLCQGGLWYYGT